MANPLASIEDITPVWLTEVLRKQGCLQRGSVTEIEFVESVDLGGPGFKPGNRFHARFTEDAPPQAPRRLYLKTQGPTTFLQAALREIEFYTHVAASMPNPPAVRCFHTARDPSSGAYHLLLEDVTGTHRNIHPEVPAPREETRRMLDTLARLHAHWWGGPRLGGKIGELRDSEAIKAEFAELSLAFPRFIDFLGDRLSSHRRAVYELTLERYPQILLTRLKDREKVTVVHNDAHSGNFLLPNDPHRGRIFIVDWEQWNIGIGAHDTAYLIALFWYPERRRRFETELVRYYHDQLLGYGVSGYEWETCWHDYCLGAINNLLVPFWAWVDQGQDFGWHRWHQLEKAMLAFEDLGCDELLRT